MKYLFSRTCLSIFALGILLIGSPAASAFTSHASPVYVRNALTPIKHLVVIFDENVSFDHYFGTYPYATNPPGEPSFQAVPGTPTVNGLTMALLNHNPNLDNPRRLDRSEALTCDQDHSYTDEQKAFDHGLMDKFVQSVSGDACSDKSLVMDYYDGNTVTALWNYAQHFALNDDSFGTTFGPSTPGALNLISGQTHGASQADVPGKVENGTDIGDLDPLYDDCSKKMAFSMSGQNIGNLLNAQNVTWGWFQGGFRPTSAPGAPVVCASSHQNIGGVSIIDYTPHHEPFQYYQSTSNPKHLPPSSVEKIGQTDQANHQYDLADFWAALDHGFLPAVNFLKPPAYEDSHAGHSDPLDEQHFLVDTLNRLQKSPLWSDTAVIIAYDDSDGWYDHVIGPIVNQSSAPADALSGVGLCSTVRTGTYQDRCGYGPRLPLLLISPFARKNFVDHSLTDQSSILRFIEDNWNLGRIGNQSFDVDAGSLDNMLTFAHPVLDPLILNPQTGEPV